MIEEQMQRLIEMYDTYIFGKHTVFQKFWELNQKRRDGLKFDYVLYGKAYKVYINGNEMLVKDRDVKDFMNLILESSRNV